MQYNEHLRPVVDVLFAHAQETEDADHERTGLPVTGQHDLFDLANVVHLFQIDSVDHHHLTLSEPSLRSVGCFGACRTSAAASVETLAENRRTFAVPEMERKGYNRVKMTDVSTEILMGKTVHDTNDSDVGTVTDILLDGDGQITDVIIDFDCFLGVGSNPASLEYEELTILAAGDCADLRIYVDASKEQIQKLPRYMPLK